MKNILKPVLVGGLVAATLDILYAFAAYAPRGVTPLAVLQSVASGIQGKAAYDGGMMSGLLGLGLHFGMALLMAAAFMLAATRISLFRQKPFIIGPIYGLGLFGVMTHIVVPLSNAYPGHVPQGWYLAGALFTHTIFVGLPIAYAAKRWLKN